MKHKVTILGGGPAGYEAALVAANLGAEVTLIENQGIGGSSILTDCVPSKALIASAPLSTSLLSAPKKSFQEVNQHILTLAKNQSDDVRAKLLDAKVNLVIGKGIFNSRGSVQVSGKEYVSDTVLIATGGKPRILPDATPDGERILSWNQLYNLKELPKHLIVIGSGVTGAEFAFAYIGLGSEVTLISSRTQVLPGNDSDAASVVEKVFEASGGVIFPKTRAKSAKRIGDTVEVALEDGRIIIGSHVLVTVGSVPNTTHIGLEEVGITRSDAGFIAIDRVSRTNVFGIYAAGDCTGVMPLASVAAQQGRIAMQHALGEAVSPLDVQLVSATIFTTPEIANVGICQEEEGVRGIALPLYTNARAKMEGIENGFIKLFARGDTVVGGVVCSPRASELIYPITIAVSTHLNLTQLAQAFTIYPSLSGSVSEAARQLSSKTIQ